MTSSPNVTPQLSVDDLKRSMQMIQQMDLAAHAANPVLRAKLIELRQNFERDLQRYRQLASESHECQQVIAKTNKLIDAALRRTRPQGHA